MEVNRERRFVAQRAICWLTQEKWRLDVAADAISGYRSPATGTEKMRTLFLINKRKNLPGKHLGL